MAEIGTVLVTGAAKRLGRAIALDLARHGWNIALHFNHSKREAEETADRVRAEGRRVALLPADLSNEEEAARLIPRAADTVGKVTALVNSAAVFEPDDWATVTGESWNRHMAVNARAPFILCQAFATALPQGDKGAIVNIIDQRVLKPTPLFLSYGASKAALYWLNTTLAQALAPRIRVNAVAPGPTIINPRQSKAHFRRQRDATILGSGAEPQDVCHAVRYLLTASAVTGEMIAVDGGQRLIWQTPDTLVSE